MMATRLKAVLPLTLSIGLLAFGASEVALNFTFHWVTVQDGVFGKYGLPQGTHLVLPALFVAWGLYFLLGADGPALGKTVIAALTGTLGATIAMVQGPAQRGRAHLGDHRHTAGGGHGRVRRPAVDELERGRDQRLPLAGVRSVARAGVGQARGRLRQDRLAPL
jgi:hypothetical protein